MSNYCQCAECRRMGCPCAENPISNEDECVRLAHELADANAALARALEGLKLISDRVLPDELDSFASDPNVRTTEQYFAWLKREGYWRLAEAWESGLAILSSPGAEAVREWLEKQKAVAIREHFDSFIKGPDVQIDPELWKHCPNCDALTSPSPSPG